MKTIIQQIQDFFGLRDQNSLQLKLVEKSCYINDDGRICFLLTLNDRISPQEYRWEYILSSQQLLQSIEEDSMQYMRSAIAEIVALKQVAGIAE